VSRFVNGSPQVYNGGKATLYGLDSDATLRVTEALTVSAGIELEHPSSKDFPNADFFLSCPVAYPTVCSLSATGKQLPQAPSASGTVNIDYRAPLMQGELHLKPERGGQLGLLFSPEQRVQAVGVWALERSIGWSRGFYTGICGGRPHHYIYPSASTRSRRSRAHTPTACTRCSGEIEARVGHLVQVEMQLALHERCAVVDVYSTGRRSAPVVIACRWRKGCRRWDMPRAAQEKSALGKSLNSEMFQLDTGRDRQRLCDPQRRVRVESIKGCFTAVIDLRRAVTEAGHLDILLVVIECRGCSA